MEFKPFKRRLTVHNNEHIRALITLQPPTGESMPDISGWTVQAPAKRADGELTYGSVAVDTDSGVVTIDVDPGQETGRCMVDVLTDFGTGTSWIRLGSITATVKDGAGQHD